MNSDSRTCVVLVLTLLLGIPSGIAAGEDGTPTATLRLGRAVKSRKLLGSITSKVREGDVVYAWALVTGAKGKKIEFVWFYEDKAVSRFRTRIGSSRWRTWSRLRMPYRELYPAGGASMSVVVRIVGGPELAVEEFGVVGPCKRTHDCEQEPKSP